MVSSAKATLRIQVIGPFRVVSPEGIDLTPASKKACALLALLALSPAHRRPKRWLQDHLWSDRGQKQGSDSLRQCLRDIRKALGTDDDVLLREKNAILALDRERVTFDLDIETMTATGELADGDAELLEGIDARDEEFEEWLRVQRS